MREWDTYLTLLDNVITVNAEALLVAEGDQVHFMRGTIFGIREAVRAVDATIKAEENERTRRIESADRIKQRSDAALFGTGFWNGNG
jgi:hypothetical protein